jgi:acyl-CoA reductase-like NAD-dependent aldehyde dehydrogenase
VPNWIGGEFVPAEAGETFEKLSPHTGKPLARVARSRAADVERAMAAARAAQPAWADTPPVQRGLILHEIVKGLQARAGEIGAVVAAETGKAPKEGIGETGGAAQCGLFFASEGQRLYGRTTTSGVPNKHALTVREPLGVAALIIAANTPIANVAWKVFPALVCGNAAVLKAAEDTPATAWIFAEVARDAGLPPGVLNVVQGFGEEAGAPLVEHEDVDVISFTGSTAVGRFIQRAAAERMVRISLELGGKNPLVVCDDADLDVAAEWSALSAFSNAGQRCASGSRLIVFESVYDRFREILLRRTETLRVGPTDDDDFGPVINERQLVNMLAAVEKARADGATILAGGRRLDDPDRKDGFYLAPTLIEDADPDHEISRSELFGPIACLYRVKDYAEALALANRSPYGLTASVHTRSLHRAIDFSRRVRTGVAVVNAGTYGSEPHMPFGGLGASGNGTREPGTEALDVYSELKDIYINIDPEAL